MIVRANYDLRAAVFKVANAPITPSDLSHLLPIMPDWLKTMLVNGSVLIIDKEDFESLPEEITPHLEVLSR